VLAASVKNTSPTRPAVTVPLIALQEVFVLEELVPLKHQQKLLELHAQLILIATAKSKMHSAFALQLGVQLVFAAYQMLLMD